MHAQDEREAMELEIGVVSLQALREVEAKDSQRD